MAAAVARQDAVDHVVEFVAAHQVIALQVRRLASGKSHRRDHVEPAEARQLRGDFLAERKRQIVRGQQGLGSERQHADAQAVAIGRGGRKFGRRPARHHGCDLERRDHANGVIERARLGRRFDVEYGAQRPLAAGIFFNRLRGLAHVGERTHQDPRCALVGRAERNQAAGNVRAFA